MHHLLGGFPEAASTETKEVKRENTTDLYSDMSPIDREVALDLDRVLDDIEAERAADEPFAVEAEEIREKPMAPQYPVPSMDTNLDNKQERPEVYPNYNKDNTFVISGPIGDAKFPGRQFKSKAHARMWVETKYGRIIEEHTIPRRWSFRVNKPVHQPVRLPSILNDVLTGANYVSEPTA
jgi:hypothetical protein